MSNERKADSTAGASQSRDVDLEKRLDQLSQALEKEKDGLNGKTRAKTDSSGNALAMRLGSEFVAAVLVGAVLGWGLDKLAGTAPWGMVIFLLLGFAAGVRNVIRASTNSGLSGGRSDDQPGGER